MTKTYDPKCYDLASEFIPGDVSGRAAAVRELAEVIQDTVEDWLDFKQRELDMKNDPSYSRWAK